MEYRKFGDTYIVRMDRDEEILAQLKIFAEKEQVKLASVTGLGAVKDFTVGVFDSSAKAYKSLRYIIKPFQGTPQNYHLPSQNRN